MTKNVLASLAIFAALAANADGGVATIRCHSALMPDSTDAVIWHMIGGTGSLAAQPLVHDGQFSVEVPVDTGLTVLSLSFFDTPGLERNGTCRIYVRPGTEVEIEGNDNVVKLWTVRSDVPEQAQYDGILNSASDIWRRYYGNDDSEDLFEQLYKRQIQYLSGRPLTDLELTYLADEIAHDLAGNKNVFRDELLALYESLPQDAKQSEQGRAIHFYLYPSRQVGVGDAVPDIAMYDLDGGEHHFSELLGKWVLVDLWSGGCGPCIQAIPEMKKVEEYYGDRLATVSLSLDKDARWRKATDDFGVTGRNWSEGLEGRGLYQRVDAKGMPTYVILNPEGKIEMMWTGYGPGLLLSRLPFVMRERGAMERTEAGGVVKVAHPAYADNNTDCIEIKGMEISDKGTTVHFEFYYAPKMWIRIAPGARLVGPDGKSYNIIAADGIALGQETYPGEDGRGEFSLTFEPFDAVPDAFDFFEEDDPNGWHITGIKTK